jgi:cyclomaltodextrinase / maltogenic alpha-amylase / neopullulanase
MWLEITEAINRYVSLVPCLAASAACVFPQLSQATDAPNALSGAAFQASSSTPACKPNPLGNRDLFLRGSFNGWSTSDKQRFTYACNRFVLVTNITGEHNFKVGDDAWSTDADLGVAKSAAMTPPWSLVRKAQDNREIRYRFNGTHRLELRMTDSVTTLNIATCDPPPLGNTTLYLRGTMNNWTAQDDYAFQFSCDGYYLNVNLQGKQEFKLADAANTRSTTLIANGDAVTMQAEKPAVLVTAEQGSGGNLHFNFTGEHTIRLAYVGGRPSLSIGPRTFADPRAASVTDANALSLKHDTREAMHKSPFGAVTAGTAVDFALTSNASVESVTMVVEKRRLEGNQDVLEYKEVARLSMQSVKEGDGLKWRAKYGFSDIGVFGYYFIAKIGKQEFAFQNNRNSIYWTRERGSNGVGVVEPFANDAASVKAIRRFRHTVFAKDFVVPSWARDVVYYYIFPERFRNGNKANDPKPGRETYQDKGVEFHANWNDRPFKPKTGDGSDDVYNNDFFGGDLAGIIEKLDYIKDLGANTIYMTPVFQAPSNHKYDTADYKKIDPAFGTNADFETLTREAAKRGIRVIPDTSLNHTGADSIYFDRYKKYASKGAFEGGKVQPNSPYASWFKFDTTQTDPNKQFKGWVDITDLPELDKSSASFREFAYGAKDSVMKLWLDRGAAGWRMDVAPWVPDDFWREWRKAIKTHKPDALTVSETWFDSSKYLLGDTFDSTMNYIFRNTVMDFAAGGNAKSLYQHLEFIREVYPPQAHFALMNLLSTHDAARALHNFGYEWNTTDAKKIEIAKQRLLLAVFFQMTYPGAPTIYYGDEVGVTGGDDPYNRQTYPWADTGGKPDLALHAEFKKLVKMRHDHDVLRHGTLSAPIYADENVIVLLRTLGNVTAVVALNNAASSREVNVKLPPSITATAFHDTLSGDATKATDHSLRITLPAMSGRALISTPK